MEAIIKNTKDLENRLDKLDKETNERMNMESQIAIAAYTAISFIEQHELTEEYELYCKSIEENDQSVN